MKFGKLRRFFKKLDSLPFYDLLKRTDERFQNFLARQRFIPPHYFYDVAYLQKTVGSKHAADYKKKEALIIMEVLKPNSVVDFGCGRGWHLNFFRQWGVNRVLGYEGSKDILKAKTELCHKFIIVKDLRYPIDFRIEKFDLAMSLEVMEHIAPKFQGIFLKNMISHSNTILLQGASPGYKGTGEINLQEPVYWENEMKELNFVLDKRTTRQLHHLGMSKRAQVLRLNSKEN